jgi:outer membrane protein OmpA-like peptidoglycan-associated protein
MKKIANLFIILGSASLLAACSYFDTGETVDVSAQKPAESVDLTTGQVQSQVLDPVEYRDVADVIHRSSDGRVEVFPLDGEDWRAGEENVNDVPGPQSSAGPLDIQPVSAVPVYNETYLNAYPGVEVFPLDDEMAAMVNPRVVQYAPPVSELTPFPGQERGVPDHGYVSLHAGGNPLTIYFDHDSVSLKQEDLATLSVVSRGYSGQDISVMGHASVMSSIQDPVQRKIINLKISMDRAFAVARALIESGIPPERIETKGYGETRPPVPSHKPVDVASRRVEVSGVSVQ